MTIHRSLCGHIGIIIINVLIVLVVPGNHHAPHVAYGRPSDPIWDLAERRRTYASRKWVMSKKKKRSQTLSNSSHGPAARGKTHKSGNLKGTCTGHGQSTIGQPANGQSSNGQEDITDWPLTITGHRSWVNGHRPNGHNTGNF